MVDLWYVRKKASKKLHIKFKNIKGLSRLCVAKFQSRDVYSRLMIN
jgi:hypothetical protein